MQQQPLYEGENGSGQFTETGQQIILDWIVKHRLSYLVDTLRMKDLDAKIKEVLFKFQISEEEEETKFASDLKTHLGITEKEYKQLGSVDLTLPLEAAIILEQWLKKSPGVLLEKHRANYGIDKNLNEISYFLFKKHKLWLKITFFLLFRGKPIIPTFKSYDKINFECTVEGEYAERFSEELKNRTVRHIRRSLCGKILDGKRRITKLKLYDRSQLTYPSHLEKKIEELIATFENWCKSKTVPRWGYFLIGRPGTGKTTIGGLIAKIRPPNCTFLYCPASSMTSIEDVFWLAETLSPCVLQIDDIDLVARSREERQTAHITSFLMEKLEGLEKENRIFTILTTNDPSSIEPAIINRAGRVGTKLILDNFQDCCSRLMELYANKFNLPLRKEVINSAVKKNKKESNLTPDEVRNICERLYLKFMHRNSQPITADELIESMHDVYDAFNNPEYQKTRLKQARKNIGLIGSTDIDENSDEEDAYDPHEGSPDSYGS